MRAVEEQVVQPCPQCGVEIRGDRRFTVWCAACDWNVDPQGPVEEKQGRLERRRRTMARQYGERLLEDLAVEAERPERERPRQSAAGVLAYAIALLVHGVTLALLVGGLWLLIDGWGGFGMVPGLFLLGLAVTLRPRLNRLPSGAHVVSRSAAPELYALVDEVAAALGTRSVDVIVLDAQSNASVTHLGVRRRVLTLGLPLWEVLSPQERIALLGHELGHFTHRDTRHGMVVGTAYSSLTTWRYYLSPITNPTVPEYFVNLFYLLPRWLITGVVLLLDLLTTRASQRSEYLADTAAAQVASTEAAVGTMDRLLVLESIDTTLYREVNARRLRGSRRLTAEDAEGLWEALAAHLRSVPESEHERRRRVSARRGHSVDATHPPTHLRRALLLRLPPLPAAVHADSERTARLAAELAQPRAAVALELVREGVDPY
ncbi:M48 family metallopeptidase [Streptomyces justiciae]|uniref:M48 family metallopeptidase n=1 Tax=Streptomyces justiciae TaxID=2780140 RepID=UPI001881B8CB|nr:M48 family metallopeptidase [Streptomyces justiciae]MBE8474305.1 M48 family metallopeptidase [Streptomyces justiciae]MCW8377865.1 M48 family metallopeptidase [Streptomyces justiciae]